jgi:malonyl CoA-acyl carrier protein transacylase
MVDEGVDIMVECGAGSALTGMIRRIAPGVTTATVGDGGTLDEAAALLTAPERVAAGS